ncbi:diphthamide biosynthesis protein [uncultured archaeon]|nr:diphthamide biosynthesis protein [uncultured archaeon]
MINVAATVGKLRKMNAKKILLQVPDGLKPNVFDYFSRLSSEFNVIVSSEGFYGACDTGNMEVYKDVDCIVQLGHSEIPNINYPKPVIFEEYRNEKTVEIDPSVLEPLVSGGSRRVGLVASIQYMNEMQDVRRLLEDQGIEVRVGESDGRMRYAGQVLGCNFSSAHSVEADVDSFLVVSTGMFHAIGVQLSTSKDVFLLDLNDRTMRNIKGETDKFLRKRYGALYRARDARKFCVVVDTKVGQHRRKLADVLMNDVRKVGGEPVLLTTNEVNPMDYENMRCDAVIFTGCPRVPIDDHEKFTMPVMTPPEFQTIFGLKNPGRYIMDEIVAVDDLN